MAHIAPLPEAELAPFSELFAAVEARMGFVPNSLKTMARKPEMLKGFLALFSAVIGPSSSLPADLAQLVAHVASAAAGCRYCQAHTGHVAERRGASAEKVAAVWDYARSPLFTEAERAALALAQAAAEVPNRATAAHFDAARAHFSEAQLVEIIGIVALFGFLNRWNDSIATEIEDSPLAFAEAHLGPHGWQAGKHRRDG
ncbi:MAG: carboxymuconolactone decarboxylase family protein [Alphaproteobacteria bacterium]|nr:MAG: carboxymuconolactone decarboxylase family protein [Alphaproteobacteria bacterium]